MIRTQRELRKYRDTLSITGMGVIAFGIWSILKTVITYAMSDDYMAELGIKPEAVTVTLIIMSVIMVGDIILRIVVGISAVKEGKGIKEGWFYVIVAMAVFVPASVVSVVTTFIDEPFRYGLLLSATVEATSLVTTVEMLVSAFRVKKLTKELAGG